jgi:ABC-2 type transport system permease protein
MKTLKQIWFMAEKDLKVFATDRTSLFFFIVFPFMFIVLFNFLLGNVGSEDSRVTLRVATLEAPGGLSQQILGAMETQEGADLEPGTPSIVWIKDVGAARQQVEDGDLPGYLLFPADFTEALNAGTGTALTVVANADATSTRAALNGLAQAIATQLTTDRVIVAASLSLLLQSGQLAPADIEQAVQGMMDRLLAAGQSGAAAPFITYRTQNYGNVEATNAADFVIPGYLVMFVFFAAAITAEAIVRERANHTLERLLTTSVPREAILGGIFTGIFLRGLVQIVIFWIVGILAFHVDLGIAPAAVIILSLLMVLMSSAFALLLSTVARTRRAAGALANITALILAPLGGCWWPLFLYPDWLQAVAKITPHAWATDGFNKLMLYGADFGAAVPNMIALLVFAVVFGVVAVWRFRTGAV